MTPLPGSTLNNMTSSSGLLGLDLQLERPTGVSLSLATLAAGLQGHHPLTSLQRMGGGNLLLEANCRAPRRLLTPFQPLPHGVTDSLNYISSVLHSLSGFCLPD